MPWLLSSSCSRLPYSWPLLMRRPPQPVRRRSRGWKTRLSRCQLAGSMTASAKAGDRTPPCVTSKPNETRPSGKNCHCRCRTAENQHAQASSAEAPGCNLPGSDFFPWPPAELRRSEGQDHLRPKSMQLFSRSPRPPLGEGETTWHRHRVLGSKTVWLVPSSVSPACPQGWWRSETPCAADASHHTRRAREGQAHKEETIAQLPALTRGQR